MKNGQTRASHVNSQEQAYRMLQDLYCPASRFFAGLAITALLFTLGSTQIMMGQTVNLVPAYGALLLLSFSLFRAWAVVWFLPALFFVWYDTPELLTTGKNLPEFINRLAILLIFIFAGIVANRLIRLVLEIQHSQEDLHRDLKLAARIQQQILPAPLRLPWLVAEGRLQPASDLSGDFYIFERIEDRTVFFAIGDVEGKGVAAAFTMAKVATMITDLARECSCLDLILSVVNDHLCKMDSTHATVLIGMLRKKDGEPIQLHYAKAGHENGILIPKNGPVAELSASGLPLGAICGEIYEERSIVIEPGSKLLFYTDGLVEYRREEVMKLEREQLAHKAAGLANAFSPDEIGPWLDSLLEGLDSVPNGRRDDVALLGVATLPG